MFLSFQEELDLTAPNKAAMLSLPSQKKWQIYCSRKGSDSTTDLNHAPEHYIERLQTLATVRFDLRFIIFIVLSIFGTYVFVVTISFRTRLRRRSKSKNKTIRWTENCPKNIDTQFCYKVYRIRRATCSFRRVGKNGLPNSTKFYPY